MSFVGQQRQLPVLKQFLNLYTTISLPKLAGLMDTDEAAVKEQLRVLEVSLFPHGMIPDVSHNWLACRLVAICQNGRIFPYPNCSTQASFASCEQLNQFSCLSETRMEVNRRHGLHASCMAALQINQQLTTQCATLKYSTARRESPHLAPVPKSCTKFGTAGATIHRRN